MISSTHVTSRTAIAALLFLAACGSSDRYIPPPPELVSGGAIIWAVRQADGVQVYAGTADDRPLLSVDVPPSGVVLELLSYNQPLEALGLGPGLVTPVSPDECGARTLPTPARAFELEVDEADRGWRPLDAPSADLLALAYAGPCPCWDFEVVEELPLEPRIRALVSPAPDHVFAFTEGGGIWRLDALGLSQVSTSTRPAAWWAIAESPERLWVAGTQGLWVGHPSTGFTLRNRGPRGDELRVVAGGPTDEGWEVYGMTYEGIFTRFAPGDLVELGRKDPLNNRTAQVARMAWLGPGHLVATEPGTLYTYLVSGETWEKVSVGVETRGLMGMAPVDGAAVGVALVGQVFRFDDGVVELGAPELAQPTVVLPTGDGGFIYTGTGGYLQQYHPDFGFCPTRYLLSRPRFLYMVWAGEDLILGSLSTAVDRPGSLVRVRPVRALP